MNPLQQLKQTIVPSMVKKSPLDFAFYIWDVDGTILDSEPIHKLSVIETCRDAGINVDDQSVISFLGKSHFDTYKKVIEYSDYDRPFEEFLTKTTKYYIENLDKIKLRDDVLDVLNLLDSHGKTQAIFSNNPGNIVFPTAEFIEKKIGKKGFFQQVISLDGTPIFKNKIARKPNPEGYHFALDILETTADQALVFEDSATGTSASKAAGIYTVGWAHGNENDLKETKTDLIVSGSLAKIFKI